MKNYLLFFGWIFLSTYIAKAQVPQGIPYQAVTRNAQGQPLASTNVKVRFSILDSIFTGTAIYVETHSLTTSSLGLFTANVGTGTASSGLFNNINWGQNFKFLKVELDTTATGNSYIVLGTQQMMSVPYALYAGSVNNVNSNSSGNSQIGCSKCPTELSSLYAGTSINDAVIACAALVENGKSDWRLPTLEEVNYCREIDLNVPVVNCWTKNFDTDFYYVTGQTAGWTSCAINSNNTLAGSSIPTSNYFCIR